MWVAKSGGDFTSVKAALANIDALGYSPVWVREKTGRTYASIRLLAYRRAAQLDPDFFDAWYNAGVVPSETRSVPTALTAYEIALVIRPESLDARSPQFPYARATILARLGRPDEARVAARRALELQPSYREAAELLRALGR